MTTGMDTEYIIETRELSKEFSGFVAVNDVNLKVQRGTIHALIGPNGAGKTTVFNLLTKFLEPSSGQIFYKSRNVTGKNSAVLARRGMVRSFQISAVFPYLSVLENVRVALQRKLGTSFHFWKSDRSLDILKDQAMAALEEVELTDYADALAAELPYGRKRALELATTLALKPEVMLLDEPTSGMGHEDVGRVVDLIRKAAENRTVLMVEHNLKVVANLSHTITVMQRGQILAEGNYEEVSNDPAVLEAYVGGSNHA
jgi:branched-chain amino acid transport system ATP-binding protein